MIVFESRIGEIVGLASRHFRALRPEAREEAVQNTIALAWKYYLSLKKRGKDSDEKIFRSMIFWAIRHTKQGRLLQGQGPQDILDRRSGEKVVENFDLNSFVGRSATIPDTVAFRIDTEAFLSTLSPRQRSLSLDLGFGMLTSQASLKYCVTAGSISQFRARFKRRHSEFFGEA